MEIPTIQIPPTQTIETISIPLPTADVPFYKMIIVPPSDLERPEGTEEIKTESTTIQEQDYNHIQVLQNHIQRKIRDLSGQ